MTLSGVAPPDPYLLYDSGSLNWANTLTYRVTSGRSLRSPVINPNLRNLVTLLAGQSLGTNVLPSLYVPTNGSVLDNVNIYDGQMYDCAGPLLGTAYANYGGGWPQLGPGHVGLRVNDRFITNNKFDRGILVPTSIGATSMEQWATGIHANRIEVAMMRLADLGIVPGMTGVTFALILMIGHADYAAGTSQSVFESQCNTFISRVFATGFNGRIFICSESAWKQTSNAIRSAQAAVRNGTTVFDGGDIDSSTIDMVDGVHPSNAGGATMETIIYNAMVASGAPY